MNRILIIEDNSDIRYTLKEICTFAGWDTEIAENGYIGVGLFEKHKFDLVLVDYHMPVYDGIQTVKAIRKNNKIVPIIVLTIDERQELANELLDLGANDFALKPIKAPDLIARIKVNLKAANLSQEKSDTTSCKGISKNTQAVIIQFLELQKKPVTIDEIASGTDLAYQTIHRYLSYLTEKGLVEIDFDYGKKGRPKNVYWLTK